MVSKTAPGGKTAPGQTVAAGILVFIVIAGVGAGAVGMISSIKEPFKPKYAEGEASSVLSAALQADQQDIFKLKATDTDGDGISDYDETYTYSTSPYLADSDSDGIDDKVEIERGTDPNCADGKNCFDSFAGSAGAGSANAEATLSADEMASARAELEKLTPAQIRDILRKQGVADDKLSTLSDDQLKDIYLKSLEKTFANAKAPSSAQGSGTAQPVPAGGAAAQTFATDPSTLTPAQIRELVLQTGQVTKEQIDEVDDATLRTMFLQAVQKAQAEQSIKGN